MKTAKLIKTLNDKHYKQQALYELSEPLKDFNEEKEFKFVVVSAINNEFGIETYVFGADKDGNITDWGELPGSFKGSMDLVGALGEAGYAIENL